jgi:DNA-binding SARP family transcriptional activator
MLEVTLFGRVVYRVHGVPVLLPTRKAVALIAFLLLEGETPRTRLARLFWSHLDEEDARRNLRQELYRITVTPLGAHLDLKNETVALREPFSSDATRFRDAMQDNPELVLEMDTGRLLGELELRGAGEEFSAWLETTREQFNEWRREALERRATQLELNGNLIGALQAHLEILHEHEYRERHHREVMRLHASLGDHLGALRQYERCREILRRELALEPSPETQALAERIRAAHDLPAQTGMLEYHLRFNPGSLHFSLEFPDGAHLEFEDVQALADYLVSLELQGLPDA